jgi:Zinc carboxypeptidase.
MVKSLSLLVFLFFNIALYAQPFTVYEQSKGLRSATYAQTIDWYHQLDVQYNTINMQEAGPTDAYYPLHVVYYDKAGKFDVAEWKREGKLILLINNGIHPGEPDGIDASMMLMRDAASGKIAMPDNIVLAVIPVFNIGGMLNRGSYSRANQNGPEQYGFRGSAQNLDLNRDFIKMDAQETQSLVRLFHKLDPDLFIDNHVSNGSDYQYIMTLLSTQHSKLGGSMGAYLEQTLEPAMYSDMKKRGYDLVPYVNHWGHTPDKGWKQFHEGPRFASGFTALFQTFGFVPETHMLKTFRQRTDATYALMQSFIGVASSHAEAIKSARAADKQGLLNKTTLPIEWRSDTTASKLITFNGYEAGYKPSEVSGKPRLYYDRKKPYTKQVPFYNIYLPAREVAVPQAYIIPQGWARVIERLNINGVKMQRLEHDTTMRLTVYYIDKYETSKGPYEGHYLHSNVKVNVVKKDIQLTQGDYLISLNQDARRYLVEVLEPNAPDAFFAWGFFDAILQQKEYYSDYVFEDEAAEILRNNESLRKALAEKRAADSKFAEDGEAQLDFVYRNSPYYEPVHMRYPVFRLD